MKTLRDVPVGGNAKVVKLHGEGAVKRRIMDMGVTKGVDLQPGASTPVVVDMSFSFRDLRKAGAALKSVASGNRPGVWHLDGEMGLDVLGVTVTVPLRIKKAAGAP